MITKDGYEFPASFDPPGLGAVLLSAGLVLVPIIAFVLLVAHFAVTLDAPRYVP